MSKPLTIPFNVPCCTGRELRHIRKAVLEHRKISGDGAFTRDCSAFFEARYGAAKALLTTSCTDALEMAALLLDIQPGDEVIMPSYTFVSTANAFALRGAKILFVDSRPDEPNVDAAAIEEVLSSRTKAIVVMHYGGFACAMDEILALSARYEIPVVEDAAQAIESFYRGRRLGTLGRFGTLSFHETKNIVAGEGGLLLVNRAEDALRAEIVREKGTNRSAFFRGEVAKYSWVEVGSSFLPSELNAAYLYGQLEVLEQIQARRSAIFGCYQARLAALEAGGDATLPVIPDGATINGHLFYLMCPSLQVRGQLLGFLKEEGILATFHYVPLHNSGYYAERHDGRTLRNCERYGDQLIRLPLYYAMTDEMVDAVCAKVLQFFGHS